MEILTKKVGAGTKSGMACGPVWTDAACAEMSVEDSGKVFWISANWMSDASSWMQVYITEGSSYKYFVPEYDEDGEEIPVDYDEFGEGDEYSFESLSEYEGPYEDLVIQLVKMVYEAAAEKGFISENSFDYKEDIWPWLKDIGVDLDIPSKEEEIENLKKEYGLSSDLPVIPYDGSKVTDRGNHIISFNRGIQRIYNAGMRLHLEEGDIYLHEQIDWNGGKKFFVGKPELDPMDAYRKIDEHDPNPDYGMFHKAYWDHHFEVKMDEEEAMATRYCEYFKKIDEHIRDREDEIVFD